MGDSYFTEEERAEHARIAKARIAEMSDAELAAAIEQNDKDRIKRDEKGQFLAGAPTPNPKGRGAGKEKVQRRRFGMSQTVKDLLEQLEQPVEIRKGKVTRKVPAIIAINERLIHMAVNGDWNAMKKVLDLREKYSDIREQTLVGLLEQAQQCRAAYRHNDDKIPPEVEKLLQYVERRVEEGQFDAG